MITNANASLQEDCYKNVDYKCIFNFEILIHRITQNVLTFTTTSPYSAVYSERLAVFSIQNGKK